MKKIILFLFVIVFAISSFANNLQITNLVVHQNGSVGGTVQFDISWDNSWYITSAPANWDAVWVFVKFRDCAATSSTAYTHGNIDATKANHTFGANLDPMTTGDGATPSALATASAIQGTTLDYSGATGIMLRRHNTTTGAVTTSQTGVVLSITNLPATPTNLTVHVEGIEMVYCLPGDFYIGDGDGAGAAFGTNGSYNRFANGTSTTPSPMLVQSATETGTATFYEMATTGSAATSIANVPAAFPKGQYGFYMMKYEITQGLYTEFLNTIASASQAAHYASSMNGTARCTVISLGSNLYTCTRGDRAMNQLGWDDFTAFLDWSCLRPMTELEYEKGCRGTAAAITNEYPWAGTSALNATTFNTPPTEDGTETMTGGQAVYSVSQGTSSCCGNGDGGAGPVRAGIFATSASTRSTAGAGYYGAMELGGNVREWVIALSSTAASNTFTRQWGDGALSSNNQNVTTWPAVGTTITATVLTNIIGQRGGGDQDINIYMTTSARNLIYAPYAVSANARNIFNGISVNYYGLGGRGVR